MRFKPNLIDYFQQPNHKKKMMMGISSVVVLTIAGTAWALMATSHDKDRTKEVNAPSKTVVNQMVKGENVDTTHLVNGNKSKKAQKDSEAQQTNTKEGTSNKTTNRVSPPDMESTSLSKSSTIEKKEKSNERTPSTQKETPSNETSPSSTVPSEDPTKSPSPAIEEPCPPYLSASKARQLFESSPDYKKVDDEYVFEDEWGYVVDVKVEEKHVGFIFFDGNTYYSAKNTTYEDVLSFVEGDKKQAEREWESLQTIMTRHEKVVQLAADAVYGQGTKEAKALYQEIMEGGKSKDGYFREF